MMSWIATPFYLVFGLLALLWESLASLVKRITG
jgi:hypothetical protein